MFQMFSEMFFNRILISIRIIQNVGIYLDNRYCHFIINRGMMLMMIVVTDNVKPRN